MQGYQTGAVRDTGGKGRMDLLPWCALIRVSRHMEDAIKPDPETGKPHYPERNWEKGLPIHTMIDSAFRHLAKYTEGWNDEDHLCAAATNLLMAMWMEEHRPDQQDIPFRRLSDAVSLVSKERVGTITIPNVKGQGKATKEPENAQSVTNVGCPCYNGDYETCNGTKEMAQCTCGGNPLRCDFYPIENAEQR